jgi:hypothetical protein
MPRIWTPRERRMVAEYVSERYPNALYVGLQEPLGLTDNPWFERAAPRCDALIILPDQVVIIEGKMRPRPVHVTQLLDYLDFFHMSPRWSRYRDKPVTLRLIVPYLNEFITAAAKKHGVDVEVYMKPWIREYLYEILGIVPP